jgi:hypothetical protein
MPTLTIELPGLPPVSHVFKDETITIGRMKGNTIVIDDSSVSLSHAKITRKNGDFYLKDLNSTNGTVINGQTVREARLQHHDRVCFANIQAEFFADNDSIQPGAVPNLPSIAVPTWVPASPAALPATSKLVLATPRGAHGSSNLLARLPALIPFIGGATALLVISLLIWKMFHSSNTSAPIATANARPRAAETPPVSPATPGASTAVAPAADTNAPSQTILQLVASLKDPDPGERRRAATALHSMGAAAAPAAAALREALQDSDPELQIWVALTLINNHVYDKQAVPILLRALQHDNSVVRQVACLSLGLIPYEQTEKDPVILALAETAGKDGDEEVRNAASSALSVVAPERFAKSAK